MDLVDEQDRVRLLLQLGNHGFQALLEVAAILGARDQRAEVQRIDHRVLEHGRHAAFDDAPGQAFGNRGLADAGFADEQRVVLATSTQDLDRAFDLVLATDQRIDLADAGLLVEIDRELAKRIALRLVAPLAFLLGGFGGLARLRLMADLGDLVRNEVDDVEARDLLLVQEIHRVRVFLAEDRDQHIGTGHFRTTAGLHVIHGPLQHPLETERRLGIAGIAARQYRHGLGDDAADIGRELLEIGATGTQDTSRRRIF